MRKKHTEKTIVNAVADVAAPAVRVAEVAEERVKRFFKPEVDSALKRFPRLFVLLVAFGVSSVYYGFEWILSQFAFFKAHGWVVMCFGVGILTLTGTLYKKL